MSLLRAEGWDTTFINKYVCFIISAVLSVLSLDHAAQLCLLWVGHLHVFLLCFYLTSNARFKFWTFCVQRRCAVTASWPHPQCFQAYYSLLTRSICPDRVWNLKHAKHAFPYRAMDPKSVIGWVLSWGSLEQSSGLAFEAAFYRGKSSIQLATAHLWSQGEEVFTKLRSLVI